ncbi:hypothetical protein KAK06_06405 [Ideonella sp. 4Y11]|uniref:Uncharacterized protein n=1 Tax=Ideonella aquatica TaxID=2824119 RepID=A0A941BIH7_9BURK|nr:hypothetical protein [Ideonella aquatica]MBQ0958587.1 hypothetical protein [Ideonella aquatica]
MQSDDSLVSVAVLALVIFFLVPSRYLRLGHYVVASFVAAFVFGSHADDTYFRVSLVAGVALGGVWLFRKLSHGPAREANNDSVADTGERPKE